MFDPTSAHARKFLGVVTVDGVGVNQKSKATRFGIVHDIPTTRFRSTGTAYAEGQYLWGTASGLLSNVAPTKPALQVLVGIIINLQGGNADILVAPVVYGKIDEASDVEVTSGALDDVLVRGSDGVWRNSQRLKQAEDDIVVLEGQTEDLETANMIKSFSYNTTTHVITFTHYDGTTTSLDLPLESAIVSASYDDVTQDITFVLQSGSTLVVPLDDLVSGLASETWVNTYFIPKTAIKTSWSATPLDTNVPSEKLTKDTLDAKVPKTDIVDNTTTDDATKVLSAKQGKVLQDTTEKLANKKSVINDSETEYPNSKAVIDYVAPLQTGVKENDERNKEQDHRIATIEEAYRKSQNGELNATKFDTENVSLGRDVAPAPLQVKVDGGLLEAKQLATNGNFSNGTTGWTASNVTGFQVVSGIAKYTATSQYGGIGAYTLFIPNMKYYMATYQNNNNQETQILVTTTGHTGNLVVPANTNYVFASFMDTTPSTGGIHMSFIHRNRKVADFGKVYVDFVYVFNISTLIANKTYSPMFNTTFDLMTDADIKTQMDKWVQDGTLPNDNVLAVGMNKRVRAVGKNLFDIDNAGIVQGNLAGLGSPHQGNELVATDRIRTKYIKVKPNTTYRLFLNNPSIYWVEKVMYYDANFISSGLTEGTAFASSSGAFITTSKTKYLRIVFMKSSGASITPQEFIQAIPQVQLELGSTATSYVPYANTDLYLQPNKLGYKLPNGVADTIEYRNGKYYFVQRVQRYVLQASDISALTPMTNTTRVSIAITNLTGALFPNGTGFAIPNFAPIASISDDVTNIGRYFANSTYWGNIITLYVANSTYTTLAQAKTALAGTVIYYQLATPIETEILALGNAQGLANGSVYIDDIMADSNLYTSRYDIENTAYPIKSIDRIVKINANGSQTELAVSGATIAGDGLSFTHTGLTANDIVWIAYEPNIANKFKSNTFVTYYDNPFIAVQPNGTPRRIVFAVDNSGVVTVSSVAV